MDGTGGEQQRRDIGGLPSLVAPETPGAAERDLGQRAQRTAGDAAGVPQDT